MELQRHGYTGYFLPDRLAVGEVPDTVRGVFMQRSRCAAAPGAEYMGCRVAYQPCPGQSARHRARPVHGACCCAVHRVLWKVLSLCRRCACRDSSFAIVGSNAYCAGTRMGKLRQCRP